MERGIHQFTGGLALSGQLVVLLYTYTYNFNNLPLFARLEAVTKLKIQWGPERKLNTIVLVRMFEFETVTIIVTNSN